MIRHVVCFKFAEGDKESAKKAKELFLSMRGRVPVAKRIEAHLDELRSPRSYDVMLEVWLEDFAALEAYQADAYHAGTVKPFMHEKSVSSVSMDFTE